MGNLCGAPDKGKATSLDKPDGKIDAKVSTKSGES